MTAGGPTCVRVSVPSSIHWVCSPPISQLWSSQEVLEEDPRPAPLLAARTLVQQSIRLQKSVMSPTDEIDVCYMSVWYHNDTTNQ